MEINGALTDIEKKAAWRYAVNEGVRSGAVRVNIGSNVGFEPLDLYVVTGIYEETCDAIKLTKQVLSA